MRQKPPPEEGEKKEPAMAGLSMDALAAKCVWQGDYTNWREKGTRFAEYRVGLVTPDQIITLLKTAKYLPNEANDLDAKFVDINWKALTGFLYEKASRTGRSPRWEEGPSATHSPRGASN